LNKYRTHNCSELTIKDIGKQTILSGWVHKKRDHGNLLFIDLRDHYGITQCIIDNKNEHFSVLEKIKLETVIQIEGEVVARTSETVNKEHATGSI
jgi:aspartyl-tRNA synthetase